jgi:hypothetical protein
MKKNCGQLKEGEGINGSLILSKLSLENFSVVLLLLLLSVLTGPSHPHQNYDRESPPFCSMHPLDVS